MKKSVLLTIILSILVFFALIMQSGKAIKHMGKPDKDFYTNVQELKKLIKDEDWEEAYKKVEEVDELFASKVKWLQFSEERDRIDGISRSLARAKAYIYSKDKGGSLAELQDSLENWKNIGG